jgi:glycosyltransferase involved in cell wall biosynthesis
LSSIKPPFLFGANAHNPHVQQMVRALDEDGALYAYMTGGVDSCRSALGRRVRNLVGECLPAVDRQLKRRALDGIPQDRVVPRWRWEIARLVALRLGGERLADRVWERQELALDHACAREVQRAKVGFFGIEFGALAALKAAVGIGTPAVVAFLSPHHRTYTRWVETEYEKFPELNAAGRAQIAALAHRRNARVDEEAAQSDWIVTGSSFTTKSLVDAGFATGKIVTVPLGAPDPALPADALPGARPASLRVAYVGPVSVRKGAHYLLRAWTKAAGAGMELDLYGQVLLPADLCQAAQAQSRAPIRFHGSIPSAELRHVYLQSSVLVLPTLCDGFGQVVSDALAHGLPVITTHNAGAADAVEHGRSGFIIPPADEDALIRTLTWCVDHPDELHAMRRPALEAASRWTWRHFRFAFTSRLAEAIASGRTESRYHEASKPALACAAR